MNTLFSVCERCSRTVSPGDHVTCESCSIHAHLECLAKGMGLSMDVDAEGKEVWECDSCARFRKCGAEEDENLQPAWLPLPPHSLPPPPPAALSSSAVWRFARKTTLNDGGRERSFWGCSMCYASGACDEVCIGSPALICSSDETDDVVEIHLRAHIHAEHSDFETLATKQAVTSSTPRHVGSGSSGSAISSSSSASSASSSNGTSHSGGSRAKYSVTEVQRFRAEYKRRSAVWKYLYTAPVAKCPWCVASLSPLLPPSHPPPTLPLSHLTPLTHSDAPQR